MTTSVRAAVRPRLLAWARERSGLGVDDLIHKFPKLTEWESGERAPTLKQPEDFARATRTPVGFLFLLLQNQRGIILANALRRKSDVKVVRLPFRLHNE